jgi:uncharacterized membrane protein
METNMIDGVTNTKPLTAAGTVLGIGMGGFVDGILFHQIFQIHNMLSAKVPTDTLLGAKVNMVWDGLFHGAVWIATAVGIALLWKAVTQGGVLLSGQALLGSMLLGFGLHIHHVYERLGQSVWDYVFLASGVALIATGWLMIRDVKASVSSVT